MAFVCKAVRLLRNMMENSNKETSASSFDYARPSKSAEEILAERSKMARRRMAYDNNKKQHKSRFDYLTITMAVLMAAATIVAVLVGLIAIL